MKNIYRLKGTTPHGHSHIDDYSEQYLQAKALFLDKYGKTSIARVYMHDWNCDIHDTVYAYNDTIWDVAHGLKLKDGLELFSDYRCIGIHKRFLPLFEGSGEVAIFPIKLNFKNKVNEDYAVLNIIKNCEQLIDFKASQVLNRNSDSFITSFEEYKETITKSYIEFDRIDRLNEAQIFIEDPKADVFVLNNIFPSRVLISEEMKEKIEALNPDSGLKIFKTNIFIK